MQSVNFQEKQIDLNGLNINYKTFGNGNIPIVILHGWGISSDKYLELGCWLHSPEGLWSRDAENINSTRAPQSREYSRTVEPTNVYKIFIPDLPGFGKSDEPKTNWKLDDYVDFVEKFIDITTRSRGFELIKNLLKNFDPKKAVYAQKKEKIVLIGHSFGGRIAIKYAAKYPDKIEKLILTGAAGIKHPLNPKQRILYAIAKIGKRIFSLPVIDKFGERAKNFLYKTAREKDYVSASPKMKEIMKKIIDEDLSQILDRIKVPTFLLWGKEDHSTPLSDGILMHEKIENSKMIVVDHANHGLPYQRPEEFANAIIEFIKKEV